MGYIQPKNDYKDGDILYGIDLNASNEVIKAGVDDNFDRIKGLNNTKQDMLESGINIKTINNESILGEGNLVVEGMGTTDYDELENQPKINNITLSGNKSLNDLGIDIPTNISDLNNDNHTVTDADYVHTDSNYTSDEKTKLAGIEVGAQANVTEVVVEGNPTPDTQLLIDSYDISPNSSASEITNQSSESTTLGYSCAYANNNFLAKTDTTFPDGIILANTSFLKGIDSHNTQINLIRAYDNRVAIGDSSKEARIYSSVIPTVSIDGVVKTLATTSDTGNLSSLNTIDKSNLVSAVNEVNNKTEVEDFISKVTFNESAIQNYCLFKKVGKIIIISYMGESKVHSGGNLIFTLPSGYKPSHNIYVPFTASRIGYGYMQINANGQVTVDQISNTTDTGRLYFNFSFTLE